MNIKKLFGLLACVAVSAVAINAYANTTTNWFGASASNTDLVLTSATTNGASITVSDSKITIYNDYSALLSVKPKPEVESPALNDGLVTITSSAYLAPSSTNNLPVASTISDAQVGFAVAYDDTNATNYYYYVRTDDSTGTWTKWAAPKVPAEGTDTSFTITIDYRVPSATFTIGEYSVTCNASSTPAFVPGETALNDVAAFGSGSISSIGVEYEVAVCAVVANDKTTKYGSIADAFAAGGTSGASGTINYINSSGTAQGATAANGLDAATCLSLGLDATSETAVARFIPADSDTGTGTIALKLATKVDTGVNVTYTIGGSGSGTQTTNTGVVTIPTTTGVYTITPKSVSAVD